MRLLLGALALLLLSALALAQVSGCGGFVELARPSKEKLDFSQIKLELVSAGGVVKERADCAPNGYYFVPIYDKGEFTLRVKATEGWTFAPAEAKVSVGSDGTCRSSSAALDAKGDLNFRLTGFTLSGSVRHGGAGCSGGLVGIDVTLTNSKGVAEKTSTAADGSFAFANVAPDAYTVSASHPRWQLSADAAKVTVGLGNAKLDAGAFVVMGYDVSGRVQSSNGEAVSGVEFLLYGSNAAAVHCAKPTSADLPADPQLGRPLCSAPSDASGAFSLSGVSCGQFVLRAYYQKAGTTFDLAPASVPVKVTGGSVAVEKPFQVVGFSVRGRVVDAKGEPVADVKISLGHASNLPVAYTDHTGAFRLEGVTAAKYTVLAFKQGYNFNLPAPNTQLSPNAAVLPDITVKSYDLCGRIDMEESSPFPRRRDVTLSGRETRTMKTTDKGLFCFDAAPGKYFLTVVVTAEEAAAGLAFSPPSLEVTMGNAPKSDVVLSQMRNFITGSVFCPGGACTSPVHVHLKGVSRAHTDSKTLDPGASPLRFSFGVLPGNYRASIESQWLCFESSAEEVDASAADRDVKFTQTGHLLVVETSHADVALQYASQDKKVSGTLRLGPRTKECLASGGVYTLTPASCLNLPPLTYDTSSPAVVRLAATQVKVPVAVKGPKGVTLTVKSSVAAETKLQGTYAEGVNAFTVLASAGETLTLVPSLPADSTQQVYPTSKTVAVTELKCIDEVKFTARDSVYLSGSVTPAIAGVDIFVHDADTNEVLVAAQTDASGRYRVGPLRDDVATRLSASKTGFQLKETSDGQFRALKLCSVAVTVKDEAGNPLPDVVLSLSGDSSYRVNNVTQADGAFTFRELFTGTYYLRPVLKEYVFTPASHSVTLGDGEDKTVAVAAKRVAYSVFGSVRTLSGEPERNFVVVAVAANGDIEETSTDGAGDFRLRGLQPGQSYTVKPRPASDTVERSSPPSMTVNVKTEDARLGAFTVIRKSAKVDLIGRVNASLEFLDSLKVELHQRDKDSLKLVATAALGPIDSFLFPALSPSGAYLLRIKSDLNAATFTWKAEDVAVDLSKADNGRSFVSLNFAAAPRSHTTEVKTRPLWGVLLVLLGLVAALNRERTVRIVRRVSESSLFRGRTADDDDDAPVIRNRQGQIVGRGTAAKKEQ